MNSASRFGKITCPLAPPLRVEQVFEEDEAVLRLYTISLPFGHGKSLFFVVFGDDTLAWGFGPWLVPQRQKKLIETGSKANRRVQKSDYEAGGVTRG